MAFAESLRGIQQQLNEAGRRNDLAAAKDIIETAYKANIRPVDILIGIVAPMLYEVGEEWRRNELSVAEEHRFTSFCNAIFQRVAARLNSPPGSSHREPGVLLMNAPGNSHSLGLRILSLWLRNKGVGTRVMDVPLPLEELIPFIVATRTRTVLISMALAEQVASVASTVERIAMIPASIRPRVVVGGYAVKVGLVTVIPGAELMGDISLL